MSTLPNSCRIDPLRAGATEHAGAAYLTGIQALARLPLDQSRLDAWAGRNTAGFVSGYRGSPLGGLDQELGRKREELEAHGIVFRPGINEDLAATAVWGSQQCGLFAGARHDGVFGLWYGKAPGLDRSCDALRHANAAGTSALGGVLLVVGDDHGCKSSTLPNASEFALRDLGIPVLAPADVQELLDFGLFGWALSRYAGCWVGLLALTDVVDSALTVTVDIERRRIAALATLVRDIPSPLESPHIRLDDTPLEQERRLALKERLAVRFGAEYGIDRIVADARQPQLVVATAGKAYVDVREAFAKLGLPTEDEIAKAGVRLAKLGMTWPLNEAFIRQLARDARQFLVIEEKRPLVEEQIRNALFGQLAPDGGPIALHGKTRQGAPLLPATGELTVPIIAEALTTVWPASAKPLDTRFLRATVRQRRALASAPEAKQARKPLYCAGCPHSISTRVPAGSRAGAGIGCHYMAQWMDRNTHAVTQMGGEGVNWLGQAPFTSERHIFVNLGDGTYFHSGILAIRAAVAAGVNVTYKILANDAVAMTGGQPIEGAPTVADFVRQATAEGVAAVRVVADDLGRHRGADFQTAPRDALDAVQRELRATPGCTVLIYDQTCATELRRRRKRGLAAEPDVRVVINEAVCEGCGDCTRQSSCVAVAPLSTALGSKRAIDQSACNKDLSCLAGFCPALVTLRGAKPKRYAPASDALEELKRRLPLPLASAERANILVAGVGGTGVVTVSQLLGMAAHLDGKWASTLDMTGLAQKGGAVLSHIRISPLDAPHQPTRIAPLDADLLLAADAVTGASLDALQLVSPQRTIALVGDRIVPTAEFVFGERQHASADDLRRRIGKHVKTLLPIAAGKTTEALFGTTTCANVMLLGAAFQAGAIPLTLAALEQAIAINGVAVDDNLRAFHYGRAACHDPGLLPSRARTTMLPSAQHSLSAQIAYRRRYLVAYQDEALARRYEALVQRIQAAEQRVAPASSALTQAVAQGYFQLLAVKDEYEVARLFVQAPTGTAGAATEDIDFATKLTRQFEPIHGRRVKATYHFAPPLLPSMSATDDRPRKIAVGPWAMPLLRLLARMKRLRGSFFDPFRGSADRRLERELLTLFEGDFETISTRLQAGNLETAIAIAQLSTTIRGFGPVKAAAARRALAQRQPLMADFLGTDRQKEKATRVLSSVANARERYRARGDATIVATSRTDNAA